MACSNELILGSTTFGLRAFGGQQVPEAGRAADQLSGSGNFEALGDGLFGLLHGESGRKQRLPCPLSKANLAKKHATLGPARGLEATETIVRPRLAEILVPKGAESRPRRAVATAANVTSANPALRNPTATFV